MRVLFRYQWYNIRTTLDTKIKTLIITLLYFISDTTVFRKRREIQLYRRGQSYTSLIDTFDRTSTSSDGKMLHCPHFNLIYVQRIQLKMFFLSLKRTLKLITRGLTDAKVEFICSLKCTSPFNVSGQKALSLIADPQSK